MRKDSNWTSFNFKKLLTLVHTYIKRGVFLRQLKFRLDEALLELSRFQLCVTGRWKGEVHNSIGECRGVVACLRHAARTSACGDCRILCITESLATPGVLSKGRSSSRGVLRQSRVGASYQLGLNLRMVLRYVPSGRNWADGPSRGQKVGIAKTEVSQRVRVPGWT